MSRPRSALITRLRRRLATSVWVFALLVMSKLVASPLCQMDGVKPGASAPSDSSVVLVVDATAHDDAFDADDNADDDGPCWHAGAGGCHCSCAHGVPLPSVPTLSIFSAMPGALPKFGSPDFPPAPRSTTLRPPIA